MVYSIPISWTLGSSFYVYNEVQSHPVFIKVCGEVGEINISDKLCKVCLLLEYI